MYVLGVDIGTTGTKAMLVDHEGKVVKSSYKGYELIKPGMKQVEQRADDWWDAVVFTVRKCVADFDNKQSIAAMSLSSQGGCLIPVDSKGQPLSNALSWMDIRSVSQQEEFLEIHDSDFYYKKTGWRLNPGMNFCKMKWFKDENNYVYSGAAMFLSTVDYINFKLTGKFAIDPSNAAMTQVMNIQEKKWDKELLEITGLKEDKLPEIVESGTIIGNLTCDSAGALGLDTSVKVISGGHDQYCASIGCGAINSGDMLLSTGTAWVILGITDKPVFDNSSYIAPGPHIVKNLWGALASIHSAGVSMEWFRNNLALKVRDGESFDTESFKEIDEKASQLMERSKGLMFYPYFNGSGFPDWNFKSRSSFIGLGLEHDRYDMARAIMEAAAFNVKYSLEQYRRAGSEFKNLRVMGGASRSSLWMDIIANTVECQVIKLNESNAACAGAAVVAGVGCGMFSSYADGYEKVSTDEVPVEKDNEKVDWYNGKYLKYKESKRHLGDLYNSVY